MNKSVMEKRIASIFVVLFFSVNGLMAQDYHAINGTMYAGSLGVHNNPSSIVNTPYKWDLTILGVQGKVSTNIVNVRNYSLLSKPTNSEYVFPSGNYVRKGIINSNINLFNARIAMNRTAAISFGANLRTYAQVKTTPSFYVDTLKQVGTFLRLNEGNQPIGGNFVNSSWVELYGTYAQTIIDNEVSRLNAGVTIKLSRGISGAHASIDNGRFNRSLQGNQQVFQISKFEAQYGYSSNYDRWLSTNSTGQNLNNFLTYTEGGASIDIGAEYIIKPQSIGTAMDDDDYFDYDWKLGASLLDLGVSQYKYGTQSRRITGIQQNVTDIDINNKLDSSINSIQRFNDSAATVAVIGGLGGIFRVLTPTRLVLNADRYIRGAFYVNAELSINLSGIFGKKFLYVRQMNLLTVTPRWETRGLGFYLPVAINTEKNFWIGGAVKLGPLLIGLHNLANLVSKTSMHKGGGYVALTIHSLGDFGGKRDRRLDCPPGKL
jgi:hypothetical protein